MAMQLNQANLIFEYIGYYFKRVSYCLKESIKDARNTALVLYGLTKHQR